MFGRSRTAPVVVQDLPLLNAILFSCCSLGLLRPELLPRLNFILFFDSCVDDVCSDSFEGVGRSILEEDVYIILVSNVCYVEPQASRIAHSVGVISL